MVGPAIGSGGTGCFSGRTGDGDHYGAVSLFGADGLFDDIRNSIGVIQIQARKNPAEQTRTLCGVFVVPTKALSSPHFNGEMKVFS
jgi:hypothetical protein